MGNGVYGVYGVYGFYRFNGFSGEGSGSAAPHLKALVAGVQSAMKEAGVDSFRTSGDPASGWIVVDYVDIVLHVFLPEARAYYALEKLWTEAKPL